MTAGTRADPGAATRAVLFTGIMLGTALVVTMYWDGLRPRVPGMPGLLGLAAGALLSWLLVVGLALIVVQLLRHNRKAITGYAKRQSGRAALAGSRAARRHGTWVGALIHARAARRWRARGNSWRAPLFVTWREQGDTVRTPLLIRDRQRRPECECSGWPHSGYCPRSRESRRAARDVTRAPQEDPDLTGLESGRSLQQRWQRIWDEAVSQKPDGNSPVAAPASADPPRRENKRMTARTETAAPATNGDWKALAASTADFEPENDGHLLDWMAGEVAGMTAYGDALIDMYEHCVTGIGVDPVAMSAVHDTADAAADAAQAMAHARQKFAQHYSEVREFAANGGVLPYNGRFMTGEGEA